MGSVMANSARDLENVLENRAWNRRSWPFPHVVATDVFTRSLYLDLVVAFREAMGAGLLRRDMPGYDASGLTFGPSLAGPMRVFVTRGWHDLMCGLFGVVGTGQMSGGLHHHDAGSRPGAVHNDLNPGYFPDVAGPGEVVVADVSRCDYGSGRTTSSDVRVSQAVRAVAMVYYLDNHQWQPGDGGETGLYRYPSADVVRPDSAVAPHNNSLLLFECTPFSFHAFAHPCRRDRNAVVAWTHRSLADVGERWAGNGVVKWT